ncbi:MAG: radical SAM protein, partial [Prevotella sp.]|nr:radical SAM protein [Prevotella sp.]
DNTSEQFVAPWLDAIRSIAPSKVMIYTIDRDTPVKTLRKADKATLDGVSARVVAAGLECSVAY